MPSCLVERIDPSSVPGTLTQLIVMSASSGPKDYIKNQVFAEFASRPDLERILMVIGTAKTSVPFCLFLVSGEWRDATKKSVRVDS